MIFQPDKLTYKADWVSKTSTSTLWITQKVQYVSRNLTKTLISEVVHNVLSNNKSKDPPSPSHSCTVLNLSIHLGARFYLHNTKTAHRTVMMTQDHLPLLDLLSRLSERLSGCKRSMAWMDGAGAPATAGLTESGRPALVAGRASSTCADGVCVSTLRVQLSRVTSGMGARCPSGISCAWQKATRRKDDSPSHQSLVWQTHPPEGHGLTTCQTTPNIQTESLQLNSWAGKESILKIKKAGCNSWCSQIIQWDRHVVQKPTVVHENTTEVPTPLKLFTAHIFCIQEYFSDFDSPKCLCQCRVSWNTKSHLHFSQPPSPTSHFISLLLSRLLLSLFHAVRWTGQTELWVNCLWQRKWRVQPKNCTRG